MSFEALVDGAPPVRAVGSEAVREAIAREGRVVVAIDDDPTGTQAVAGVPLVTGWSVEDLRWGLTRGSSCLFVLANTRSLGPGEAAERTREIVRSLHRASRLESVPFVILSRSDSTLRGHFPLEPETISLEERELTGAGPDGIVLCPAYVEARRLTVGGRHWAASGGRMVPVGETEYARDATFGYESSDLAGFVAEKTGGRVSREQVRVLTIEEVRGDPERLAESLCALSDGAVAAVDALEDDDLRSVALAAIEAESRGRRLLYRTGPSFVRARAGLDPAPPLGRDDLDSLMRREPRRGLVVVGSHVPLSSRQLDRALRLEGVASVEVEVPRLLEGRAEEMLGDLAAEAVAGLGRGHVVIHTTRELVTGGDRDSSLELSRRVSAFLVDLTREVAQRARPAFVVGKGGITSSDLATNALGIRRAWVQGSMLPGLISTWRAEDGPAADLPYVVFPGNVGDDGSLAYVIRKLEGVE